MITQSDKERMIEMYDSGMGLSELARIFHLYHTTILYHIKNRDKRITKMSHAIINTEKTLKYSDYCDIAKRTMLIRDERGKVINKKYITGKLPPPVL
ncbi:hypothetical protein M0R04_10035 [Candidatus Dojkabacteria bacterium]|jgi:hypothetical protein|nr:hypothetical protein [Candidatus Dojkabacteria bacterium]